MTSEELSLSSDQASNGNKELLRTIVNSRGTSSQIIQTIEDAAELIQTLAKVQRYMKGEKQEYDIVNALSEKIADMKIMLTQIEIIFDNDSQVNEFTNRKLEQQKKLLDNE